MLLHITSDGYIYIYPSRAHGFTPGYLVGSMSIVDGLHLTIVRDYLFNCFLLLLKDVHR